MGPADDSIVKVVVCGGREFIDASLMRSVLEDLVWRRGRFADLREGPVKILHGGSRGADRTCDAVAKSMGISLDPHPAAWKDLTFPDAKIKKNGDGTLYDAAAGFRRNQQMIDESPEVVVAFPGNRGTEDTCRRAERRGIRIVKINGGAT